MKLSESVAKLSIDLGSYKNVDPDQAVNAFTSAIMGNSMALKSLGIDVTETTKKQELSKMATEGLRFESQRLAEAYQEQEQQRQLESQRRQKDFEKLSDLDKFDHLQKIIDKNEREIRSSLTSTGARRALEEINKDYREQQAPIRDRIEERQTRLADMAFDAEFGRMSRRDQQNALRKKLASEAGDLEKMIDSKSGFSDKEFEKITARLQNTFGIADQLKSLSETGNQRTHYVQNPTQQAITKDDPKSREMAARMWVAGQGKEDKSVSEIEKHVKKLVGLTEKTQKMTTPKSTVEFVTED